MGHKGYGYIRYRYTDMALSTHGDMEQCVYDFVCKAHTCPAEHIVDVTHIPVTSFIMHHKGFFFSEK